MTVCYRLFQKLGGDRGCQNSFFEEIIPATAICGRGKSLYSGIMTYPRSVNTMNREFQDDGDRLKEDFHFYLWESLSFPSCFSIEAVV